MYYYNLPTIASKDEDPAKYYVNSGIENYNKKTRNLHKGMSNSMNYIPVIY